jgi:CHAT domain-containing protein
VHPDSQFAARAFGWAERARARAFLDWVAGESPPIASIAEVQQLLGRREVLLEYSVGDSSTALWAIGKTRWQHFMLPRRATLRLQVEKLHRGLSDPATAESQSSREAARALYRALIEPAESVLKGADQLIIAADGILTLVPFEALLARDDSGGRVPKGGWLAERFSTAYAVSASSLKHVGSRVGSGGVLLVGDPDFGTAMSGTNGEPPALPRLPHAAEELRSVERLASPRPVRVLSGSQASRDAMLGLPELGTASILHLASHGETDVVEPLRSRIWLAPDSASADPSVLELGQIMSLRLASELVTLSACETGLGRIEGGEGVIGLARGFLIAGSRSVVVSLWKVEDRSTARLMERFYERAFDKGMGKREALSHARRDLLSRAETRSPFHWAPFILIGDPDPLISSRSATR